MNVRLTFFAVLVTVLVLAINSDSRAVDTRDIDKVRSKSVLNDNDFEIIEDFVAQAIQELAESRNFTSVARIRTVIVSRRSEQAQYAEQFSKFTRKYIAQALKQSEEITPAGRKLKVRMNLMILIDNLEDPRLVDLAVGLLNDADKPVSYWAVHAITNPGLIKKMTSTGSSSKPVQRITKELAKLLDSASPEITNLIAEFTTSVNTPETEELLLKITDVRISGYANWTADNFLLDAKMLKLLYSKMKDKTAVARRLAQLYSYAIQRYISDINGGYLLSETSRRELASVLVEIEDKCVGRLLGLRQSVIKRAVEQGDYTALLSEHGRLFGDETRTGELPKKLNFDYGQDSEGNKRTVPLVLPEQPKPVK